jgi:hypothetical protein
MELAIVMANASLFGCGLLFMIYLLFTDGAFTVENKYFRYDWSAERMRYRLKRRKVS